jgi:molybdenum cofactor synthesis domain-containing protein
VVLVPLDDARAHVLDHVRGRNDTETVLVADAVGRVAAEAVTSTESVPPFDNSAMDGFAVRSVDVLGGGGIGTDAVELRIQATTLAGQAAADELLPGHAVRIMTGAPMPPGADAVVPVERVQASGTTVRVPTAIGAGDHVRRAGDDLRPGDVVVQPGTLLNAGHLGILATLGVEKLGVVRRPRVGVLSTGDELVDGAVPLQPGQIRDSNRPVLLSLVAQAGAEPVDLGSAPDDEESIARALLQGVMTCDAVLTSGGVSMGDVDLIKVVLDLIGDMRWMQVAIRPAKPFAFGLVDDVPVFGLPGNPVSSVVSFELFARPAIRLMGGLSGGRIDRPCPTAIAVDGLPRRPDGKLHLVRVVATVASDGQLEVRSAGGQGSHQLSVLAAANALALVPDGDGVEPGGLVDVLLTGDL